RKLYRSSPKFATDAHRLPSAQSLTALIGRLRGQQIETRLAGTTERRFFDASQVGLPGVLARLCRIAVIGGSRLSHINGLPPASDRRVFISCCGSTAVQSEQTPGVRSFCARAGCWKCRPVG